jgi:hypothetical protein
LLRPFTLTTLLAPALLLALPQAATSRTYRTMTEAQAAALVRSHAAAIGAVLGVDAKAAETRVGRAACESSTGDIARDGRFFIQGNWQMRLLAAEHPVVLVRLRDLWSAQGYKIKRFKMFNDIEGLIIAEDPNDEVEIAVESGRPPIAVAVLILSPCYRPPAAGPPPPPH